MRNRFWLGWLIDYELRLFIDLVVVFILLLVVRCFLDIVFVQVVFSEGHAKLLLCDFVFLYFSYIIFAFFCWFKSLTGLKFWNFLFIRYFRISIYIILRFFILVFILFIFFLLLSYLRFQMLLLNKVFAISWIWKFVFKSLLHINWFILNFTLIPSIITNHHLERWFLGLC